MWVPKIQKIKKIALPPPKKKSCPKYMSGPTNVRTKINLGKISFGKKFLSKNVGQKNLSSPTQSRYNCSLLKQVRSSKTYGLVSC